MGKKHAFVFNGVDSNTFPWLLINRVSGSVLPPIERRLIKIADRPGSYDMGPEIGHRVERIKITVLADSQEELAERKRTLAQWLLTKDLAPFYYSYEPDKVYMASLSGETDLEKIVTDGETELIFIIPDPKARGATNAQQVAGGEITETESTDADWNEEGAVLTRTRADGGDLILADAGTTVQSITDTQAEWDTGTHNQTRAVVDNGGSVELDLAIEGGTTFSETDTTQEDWDAGTYDSNTKASTVIFEDFEDTNYAFNFREPSGSEVPWGRYRSSTLVDGESTHRHRYSYKAGSMSSTPLTHKYSRVDFDVNVPAGATDAVLSLWYKVSSEATYDHFRIYVDNFEIRTEGPTGSNDTDAVLEASGNVKWTKWTYPLTPGTHTIRLEYHKDGATDSGQDTCWVDDIQLEYKESTTDNGVTMDYPYDWDFYDYMGSISPNWTTIGDGVDDSPTGIIVITSDTDGADGLDRQGVVPNFQDGSFQGFTFDTLVKGKCSIYISDGNEAFIADVDTGGGWKWVRIVIHADKTASWWMDGVLQQGNEPLTSYSTNRVLFYIDGSTAAQVEIHEAYYALKDLGAPGVLGVYTSEVMDISSVSVADASSISWNETTPATTGQTITVYTRIGTDDGEGNITWDPWQEATNGGPIPGIASGMDMNNKRLQYKIEFLNYEIKRTTNPVVDSVSISITPKDTEYYTSGTWESGEIDLSPAGVAKDTKILFTGELPDPDGDGTGIGSLQVETNFAPDGVNYLGWKPATNGGSIPDISPGTDLSTAKLKVRVSLTTDDVHYSPYVSYLEITITPGYEADGERIDAGTDVGAIGVAGDSSIEWFTADPADDVKVDYSFDKNTWIECTNGAEIPGIRGTDLTGKTIYFRQRLATSDQSKTPRLLSMTWIIFPQSQNPVVMNAGTAETFPKITATFNQAAEDITITNLTTGKFAKVERSFVPGDVLVIDCDKGWVEVNGEDERRSFPIEADFFPLVVGENKIAVSPTNAAVVDVEWTERWL